MSAVRSVVLAAAWVVGAAARAADAPAPAADPLGPDGLVAVLPVAPVVGGGAPVDLYLVALGADGRFRWAKETPAEEWFSITTDAAGNVYAAGFTRQAGDYGNGQQTTHGGQMDMVVLSLTKEGAFRWVRTFGNGNVLLTYRPRRAG